MSTSWPTAYYRHSFGYERASQIARLGTVARHGIPFALHTDFTMAPALPLTSAWVAVNRLSESGAVMAPEERITVEQAMRAITVDAAYVLGLEHEIGSIRAGKKAGLHRAGGRPLRDAVGRPEGHPGVGHGIRGRARAAGVGAPTNLPCPSSPDVRADATKRQLRRYAGS